jgi:alkylation response protein AidB-like acyl-CoA dehydrogenase
MLDGGHEVNEVWFDNVEVPAENLIGEENKGWTYAKHLLSHERTNIADVNRAKRELERLKRIAKAEGVYDDTRFRDEIAKLEVESWRWRCWCCACCRPKSPARTRWTSRAC